MSYDDRDCPSNQGSVLEVISLCGLVLLPLLYFALKWVGVRRSLVLTVLALQMHWRDIFAHNPGTVDLLLLVALVGVALSWLHRYRTSHRGVTE